MTAMRWTAAALALALAAGSAAADGAATARNPVTVYNGPSQNDPLYLLSLDYPLVVISRTSEWMTVCMHDGTVGNIQARDAKDASGGIVLARSPVRESPDPLGAVVFNADKGLLLDVAGDPVGNWLPVAHASSGKKGYIGIANIFAAAAGSSC